MFAGDRPVVSIGVVLDIAAEVEEALDALGLMGAPTLHLHNEQPVPSAEHADKAAEA